MLGAIAVLFLFVVMILNVTASDIAHAGTADMTRNT